MTARKRLTEYAVNQYGLITTRQACELGVPAVEVAKLSARGALEHLQYGLYRVKDVPVFDAEAARYAEAVLRVGEDAFLTHDAVLAYHDLALVNPRATAVGSFRRVRTELPPWIKLIQRKDITEDDITLFDGIRTTRVAQAIVDCMTTVMPERLHGAVSEAYQRGLLLRREQDELLQRLDQQGKN